MCAGQRPELQSEPGACCRTPPARAIPTRAPSVQRQASRAKYRTAPPRLPAHARPCRAHPPSSRCAPSSLPLCVHARFAADDGDGRCCGGGRDRVTAVQLRHCSQGTAPSHLLPPVQAPTVALGGGSKPASDGLGRWVRRQSCTLAALMLLAGLIHSRCPGGCLGGLGQFLFVDSVQARRLPVSGAWCRRLALRRLTGPPGLPSPPPTHAKPLILSGCPSRAAPPSARRSVAVRKPGEPAPDSKAADEPAAAVGEQSAFLGSPKVGAADSEAMFMAPQADAEADPAGAAAPQGAEPALPSATAPPPPTPPAMDAAPEVTLTPPAVPADAADSAPAPVATTPPAAAAAAAAPPAAAAARPAEEAPEAAQTTGA